MSMMRKGTLLKIQHALKKINKIRLKLSKKKYDYKYKQGQYQRSNDFKKKKKEKERKKEKKNKGKNASCIVPCRGKYQAQNGHRRWVALNA